MAEPIEMLFFWGGGWVDANRPKEPCIRWGLNPSREGAVLKGVGPARNRCNSKLCNNG